MTCLLRFLKFMENKSWKIEKRGPLYARPFQYLKGNMEIVENGVTIRPDQVHIKELESCRWQCKLVAMIKAAKGVR